VALTETACPLAKDPPRYRTACYAEIWRRGNEGPFGKSRREKTCGRSRLMSEV
jgi:hypothetical protein